MNQNIDCELGLIFSDPALTSVGGVYAASAPGYDKDVWMYI